jgi:hypothetical protein
LEWKSTGLNPKKKGAQKESSWFGEPRCKLRSKAWSNSRIPLASKESKFVTRNLDPRHASKGGISVFWSGKIEQIGETLNSQIHLISFPLQIIQLWWDVDEYGSWFICVSICPPSWVACFGGGEVKCNCCEWVGLRKSTHMHNHTLSPTWSYHGASYIDSLCPDCDRNWSKLNLDLECVGWLKGTEEKPA